MNPCNVNMGYGRKRSSMTLNRLIKLARNEDCELAKLVTNPHPIRVAKECHQQRLMLLGAAVLVVVVWAALMIFITPRSWWIMTVFFGAMAALSIIMAIRAPRFSHTGGAVHQLLRSFTLIEESLGRPIGDSRYSYFLIHELTRDVEEALKWRAGEIKRLQAREAEIAWKKKTSQLLRDEWERDLESLGQRLPKLPNKQGHYFGDTAPS